MAQMNTAKRKYDHGDYASSSSSSSSPFPASARRECEVFLSFSGVDTGRNITSNLHQALEERGILTFRDSEDLKEESLFSTIRRSKIHIVIFSQGYASSGWCLLELATVEGCLQEGNRGGEIIVMPVFYGVSPSDVRNQTGTFEIAFQHHQKRFGTNMLEGWKKALRVVSKMRGWNIQGFDCHQRMEFIEEIAETVLYDLGNIKMRSQTAYRETVGFSARGNTDFGWYKLNGISLRATYEVSRPFLVFINHRGPDTKRSFAALLHWFLTDLGLKPFLDEKSIMLGEDIDMAIETAIRECKVGLAIISPDYCTSKNCLHELAMLMECNKEVIPIFFDTKVSDLTVKNDGSFSDEQTDRYSCALKFIKKRAGIEFNSKDQDWPHMIRRILKRVKDMHD